MLDGKIETTNQLKSWRIREEEERMEERKKEKWISNKKS